MLTLSLVLCLAAPPAGPKDTKVVLLLDDLSVVEAEPTPGGYAVRRGKELEPVAAARIRFVGESKAAVSQHLMAQAMVKPKVAVGVGFEAGALPLFAAKVQPVLMNRCGTCHARPEYPGTFKLARIAEGFADPDGTERNARAATLAVDRLNPAASPLLTFAAAPHGPAKATPLDRSHPAFWPLEQWVRLTAGPTTPKPRPVGLGPTAAVSSVGITAPARPSAADSTDPGPFNRAVHPERH